MDPAVSLNVPARPHVAAALRNCNDPIAVAAAPAAAERTARAAPPSPGAEAQAEERAIVARAQAGDEAAFTALYTRYAPEIERFLCRSTHDGERAAELAADTWLKVWLSLPATTPDLRWRAWLYRIATNVAIDAARHEQLVAWVPWTTYLSRWPPSQATGDDPEQAVLDRELEAELRSLLDQLPAPARRLLVLQTDGQYSQCELALLVGQTVAATKSALCRARAQLRRQRALAHLAQSDEEERPAVASAVTLRADAPASARR